MSLQIESTDEFTEAYYSHSKIVKKSNTTKLLKAAREKQNKTKTNVIQGNSYKAISTFSEETFNGPKRME